MSKETIEQAAKYYAHNNFNMHEVPNHYQALHEGFLAGAKWHEQNSKKEGVYSEKDMKQFAWECVANFLSNRNNEVEQSFIEVIIDRNKEQFKQFKKK